MRGGGVFAFASERGVEALLRDKAMGPLLKNGRFELIVGMDAITDQRALDAIGAVVKRGGGLRARALIHRLPTLFHPKFCWFVTGERLTLLLGSGNLTPGGLISNIEAFTETTFAGPEAAGVEDQINAWLDRWDARLLALDDPIVVAQAQRNSGAERTLRGPAAQALEDEAPAPVGRAVDVLIAEISDNTGGTRTQLDIGLQAFTEFFGGQPGHAKRILVQHVRRDGRLDQIERPRSLFNNRSQNYRFEVDDGLRRAYPTGTDRPVGLFVWTAGTYRYVLLWPGDPGYAEVIGLLTARKGPVAVAGRRLMRRTRVTAGDLRAAWPAVPFW